MHSDGVENGVQAEPHSSSPQAGGNAALMEGKRATAPYPDAVKRAAHVFAGRSSVPQSQVSMDFSGLAGDPPLQQSSCGPCRTTFCSRVQNKSCPFSLALGFSWAGQNHRLRRQQLICWAGASSPPGASLFPSPFLHSILVLQPHTSVCAGILPQTLADPRAPQEQAKKGSPG